MNREVAEKIANTVLYEGYMLYPYRPSAIKNQQRWNFGTLYPPGYEEVRRGAEQSSMHAECLLTGDADAMVTIRLRFLQLGVRHSPEWAGVSQPRAAGATEWDQAVERAVEFPVRLSESGSTHKFSFPGNRSGISGSIAGNVSTLRDGLSKLTVEVSNEFPLQAEATRDQALVSSLLSAHFLLYAERGEFISFLDTPDDLRAAIAGCGNAGCFPVLVGDPGERDILLCSPIILYDYPQVAPESAGDFFDGTEMDEMLTLRVLTLTPEEKQAMASSDERTRELLRRTEQTARDQLMRTHGVIRSMRPVKEP